MGKSLGNSVTLQELMKDYGPMVVRYFILQFHYRSAVDFSKDALELYAKQFTKIKEAVNKLRKITTKYNDNIVSSELKDIKDNFEKAMNEDFNTPLAMVEFNKLVKMINSTDISSIAEQVNYLIKRLGEEVFGLDFGGVEDVNEEEIPNNIKQLAELRWQAKQNKDYAKADELRKQLLDLGYEVVDKKDGFDVNKK